jgi:methylated-DNA-[protein]-cysteine S-methyltransferase
VHTPSDPPPDDAAFTVPTSFTDLAVTMRGEVVTGIRLGARGRRDAERAAERHVAGELDAYARGELETFSFPVEPTGTDFDHKVWNAVARIPYGATATYGEIARSIGVPGGARAVGHANGRNPVPIVIPCHRVVAAGGKLGGYGGGLELKRRLLALEGRVRGLRASVVAFMLAVVTATTVACGDPERPIFEFPDPTVDTIGPAITFIPAVADTVFAAGSTITVNVELRDRNLVRSVTAGVQGLTSFGFGTQFPADTLYRAQFSIPTPAGETGEVLFLINALDSLVNASSARRTFLLE